MSAFISEFKKNIFNITERDFENAALALFRYQVVTNPVYQLFVHHLGVDPQKVSALDQIPFLPLEFFKTQQVHCHDSTKGSTTFESSGTGKTDTSKHYVWDTGFYDRIARHHFESSFSSLEEYTILALLPSYLERNNSSLVHMVDHWITVSKKEHSGFYLDDWEGLISMLKQLAEKEEKVLLIGVSFALMDLANKVDFSLGQHVTVMETGGMKGRREELTREQLHFYLKGKLGVQRIYSEYGMTELLSQAYLLDDAFFHAPTWMRFFIRDTEDPLTVSTEGKGALNVIDLANVDSCAFLALQDLGEIINESGDFTVMGRLDHADIRGCSLLYL